MATSIGSILRKAGGNNPSAHRTTQYEKLAQDPSDNEEEDDVLFRQGNGIEVPGTARFQNGISHTTSNGNQECIEMDSMPTIHNARKLGSDVKVHLVRTGLLTRKRIACFILVLLSGIGIAFAFAFILPYFTGKGERSSKMVFHRTAPWTHILPELGTESAVWLVDVDGDGKKDVLFGTMKEFGFRVTTKDMMQNLCKQKGLAFPCVGLVIALRGTDGSELWHLTTYSGVTYIKCGAIDVNGDGKMDCIATGRAGTMVAFDTKNGTVLWHGDPNVLNPAWNIYAPLILPDLDLDGVPEIAITHGGDDAFPHAKLVAHKLVSRNGAGRLIMLSGKTGKSMGRVFEMARKRQTYMPPIMHSTADGSAYILIGTGEATVPGSLFMISVPDLYRYVKQWNKTIGVPNTNGSYKEWSNLICDGHGLCEIFSSSMKGLMVPPVCVDMTGDKVRDVVVAAYDGTVKLLDGETMKEIWKVAFAGYEAHSAPAPAYFNNDDTLDLMLHLNHGTWPRFNHSKVIILDGKTGQTLWSLMTYQHEMTSDLVIQTTETHRDSYVFRVQGRHGKKPFGTKSRRGRDASTAEKAYIPKQQQGDYYGGEYSDYDNQSPDYRYPYPFGGGNGYNQNPYRQQYPRYGSSQGTDEGYSQQSRTDPLHSLWPATQGQDGPPSLFDGPEQETDYPTGREDIAYGTPIQQDTAPLDHLSTQGRKNNAPVDHSRDQNSQSVREPVAAKPKPKPYISPCEQDLNEFSTEVFIMDRTIMTSPLKVTEIPATQLHYNLTANDKKMLSSIRSAETSRVKHAASNPPIPQQGLAQGHNLKQTHNPVRNQRPLQQRSRKLGQHLPVGQPVASHKVPIPAQTSSRRRLPPSSKSYTRAQTAMRGPARLQQGRLLNGQPHHQQGQTREPIQTLTEPDMELCTIMMASEMVTGTIGDVDGDGTLDLVLMFDREAPIHAADGTYIRSEYVTEVTKVNLIEVLERKEIIYMNVTIPNPDIMKSEKEKAFFEINFKVAEKQPWASYLGKYADSIYRI